MSDFSASSSASLCDRFKSMWTETDCAERMAIQDSMQEIVDTLPAAEFEEFDGDPQNRSDNPVLQYYDAALERLIAELGL